MYEICLEITIAIARRLFVWQLALTAYNGVPSGRTQAGMSPIPYQDAAKFTPLMGGPAEIAVLSGNPQTGPSSILLRFPPKVPRRHAFPQRQDIMPSSLRGPQSTGPKITMQTLHRYRHPEITGSKPAGKCIKIAFQVMKSQLSSYASKDLWISF